MTVWGKTGDRIGELLTSDYLGYKTSHMLSKTTTYKKPLVDKATLKKNVGLIHSSSELGLVERKLFNWLLLESFEQLEQDVTHEIPLPILKVLMGWENSNNNDGLEAAMKRLMSTVVHFNLIKSKKTKDGESYEDAWEATTLLSYAAIVDGRARWRFDQAMAAKLHDPAVFHWLNVAAAQGLQSSFAYALYENSARYYKVGQTPKLSVPLVRELLNATAPLYADFRYLKQRVLTPAVKEINTITDIELEVEYQREGRSVVTVQFFVTAKPQSSLLVSKDRLRVDLSEKEKALHDRMVALKLASRVSISAIDARGYDAIEQAVALTEYKVKNGEISRSAAGYLRKVIATPFDVETPVTSATFRRDKSRSQLEDTQVLVAQRQAEGELVREEREKRTTEIALLSVVERREAAKAFIENMPQTAKFYDADLAKFSGRTESIFSLFLRGWVPAENLQVGSSV